jgi:hypothetical protein
VYRVYTQLTIRWLCACLVCSRAALSSVDCAVQTLWQYRNRNKLPTVQSVVIVESIHPRCYSHSRGVLSLCHGMCIADQTHSLNSVDLIEHGWRQLPEAQGLQKCLKSVILKKNFRLFLVEKQCAENLDFYDAVQEYKAITHRDEQIAKYVPHTHTHSHTLTFTRCLTVSVHGCIGWLGWLVGKCVLEQMLFGIRSFLRRLIRRSISIAASSNAFKTVCRVPRTICSTQRKTGCIN